MTVTVEEFALDLEASSALRRYLDASSAGDKSAWIDLCCRGRRAKKLLEQSPWSGNPLSARMVIASACARIYDRVGQEEAPPILTQDAVTKARKLACRLSLVLDATESAPVPVNSPAFRAGLLSLKEWRFSESVAVTSQHVGGWRRWAAHELAREMLRAFDQSPDSLLTEFLGIGWRGISDSWVRGELTQAKMAQLRLQIFQERAQEIMLEQAQQEALRWINRTKQTCSSEAREQADNLLVQVQRLLSGQLRFEDDLQAVAVALDALSHISDDCAAATLSNALFQSASDYGLQ